MHEQFMSLCVSAWRQDRLSEPNSPDAALEVEFHFKGSIRWVYCYMWCAIKWC